MDQVQDKIGTWADQTFPKSTPKSMLAHLKKEVRELTKTQDPEEIADCVMILMHLAHRKGVSIKDLVNEKFEICKKRKWGKPDAEGVVEHIRKGKR